VLMAAASVFPFQISLVLVLVLGHESHMIRFKGQRFLRS
jgi:hypothetical protein